MLEINTLPRVAKETKKEGYIPAVYYGAHAKSTPIFINVIEFTKVFNQVGESSTITLKTNHGNETALVHDLQRDPVKNHPIHVDFYVVEKGQKLHVKVPLTFTGESAAVKAGNILVKVMHELSVEGESSALPHEITVDLALLTDLHSAIHAKDLALPKGVTLYHVDGEEVVASISEAKEENDIPSTTIDMNAIEVEQKGKKEEETSAAE